MPIREMPAFVRAHKHVKNALVYSICCCICLVIQLALMDKNVINIVFDIIIPFSASITFGCYAITMAMDRPVILIYPPTCYFVSLLINQLISVEVGVQDTYPFITMIEMIPYAFFCICAATLKLKKTTDIILRIFSIGLICASFILSVLAVFFRIIIFINRVHYLMNTFAMIAGFFSVVFIYAIMFELIKIAGSEKKPRKHTNKATT